MLIGLVIATCIVQGVAISRAAVPALDAVRFVESARSIDQLGLTGFLQGQTEPPLFPILVWCAHGILVCGVGEFREAWAASVQLAAALPLVLLPIPVFTLAKRLVGGHAAILGTVMIVCLPEVVRLGADGISDSTHLLWFSTAIALLVTYLLPTGSTRGRPTIMLLAGVATAFALLAREEAVVLVAAVVPILVIRVLKGRDVLRRSALPYGVGIAAVMVPYLLLLSLPLSDPTTALRGNHPKGPALLETDFGMPGGEALSFASKEPTVSIRRRGAMAAVIQLGEELPKAFAYLPGLLALWGFWILRRRPPTDADRLLQAFFVLLLVAVVVHTAREGYLAARHLLPLTVASTACIGLGTQAIGHRLGNAPQPVSAGQSTFSRGAIVLTVIVAFCFLLYAVRPLHTSRTGHRSAATWLALNAHRGEGVVDTQGWTGLYSGMVTVPYARSRSELLRPGLRYLVIEDRELDFDSRRSRTLRHLLQQAGTRVASFPVSSPVEHAVANVLIFEWNPRAR